MPSRSVKGLPTLAYLSPRQGTLPGGQVSLLCGDFYIALRYERQDLTDLGGKGAFPYSILAVALE